VVVLQNRGVVVQKRERVLEREARWVTMNCIRSSFSRDLGVNEATPAIHRMLSVLWVRPWS